MLIEDEEYLAVYFSGPCDDPEDDCALILDELESVDTTMQVEIILEGTKVTGTRYYLWFLIQN